MGLRRWPAVAALIAAGACLDAPPASKVEQPDGSVADGDGAAGGDGSALCPAVEEPSGGQCTGVCDGCTEVECTADCMGPPGCSGSVDCPPGLDCYVNCDGDDSCIDLVVNCPPTERCELLCSGDDACLRLFLSCGEGPCAIRCEGDPQACRETTVICGAGPCVAECLLDSAEAPTLLCDSSCECTSC